MIASDASRTLLKIDFLYSACIVPRKDKTRGQVMLDAMEFFRQLNGRAFLNDPDVFLLRSYNEKLGKMRKAVQ